MTTESEKRTTESDRRVKILDYVKERQGANQKTTKTTVIRYMKEKRLSSRETTLNLINELIREGKLNKEEINSQVHFLTINYENEFIKIKNYLEKIDAIVDRILEAISKINREYALGAKKPVSDAKNDLLHLHKELESIYTPMISLLIERIDDKIQSSEDQSELYVKVAKLNAKISKQSFDIKKMDILERIIKRVGVLKSDNNFKTLARKFGINIDSIEDAGELAENIRKEFLSYTM